MLKGRLKTKAPMVTCQKIDIRGIRSKSREQVCVQDGWLKIFISIMCSRYYHLAIVGAHYGRTDILHIIFIIAAAPGVWRYVPTLIVAKNVSLCWSS